MRLFPVAAIIAFLSSLAASDWKRVVDVVNYGGIDVSTPQNLSYFVEFPELRDLDEYICHMCTPAERAKKIRELRGPTRGMSAEVRRLGMVKGFDIFDVFYWKSDDQDTPHADGPIWKSILVKVGPDQYREIYLYQCAGVQATHPSVLIGPVLYTQRREGNMGMQPEEYFWFDESGPTRVVQRPIVDSASRVLPAGLTPAPWSGLNGSYASPSLVFQISTIPPGTALCCAPGFAEVKVALDKGKIVIVSVR